ncbi:hypothetical protein [Azohydromonas caseinilytica]|uniref:hypothetical protein n=1 Tax=Azohydromonas caseinilytica TaxID=2728836 RepID=UPI001F33A10E|nr:hypothetical protein [Azohydromonas caseinilytica]
MRELALDVVVVDHGVQVVLDFPELLQTQLGPGHRHEHEQPEGSAQALPDLEIRKSHCGHWLLAWHRHGILGKRKSEMISSRVAGY